MLKLGWAEHHLRLLEVEIANYARSNPYVLVLQEEAKLQEVARRWDELSPRQQNQIVSSSGNPAGASITIGDVTPTPDTIPLIIGDVLSNLRAALDHVAWQLAIVFSDDDPIPGNNGTRFPIWWEDPDNKRARPLLKPFTCKAVEAFLDGLQPYHRKPPQAHPLFVINDLVNIDKHRVLPVITTVVDHTQVTCRFPNGSRIESYGGRPHIWDGNAWRRQALEPGAHVGTVLIGDAISALRERPGKVQVDCKLDLVISLDEPVAHPETQTHGQRPAARPDQLRP